MESATTSCRCEQGEIQDDQPVDYERYGFGPDGGSIRPARSEVLRLAALALPNGAKIEFWGDPAEGEVGLIEMGGAHARPTFSREPKLSILEIYTRLVPEGVPVPEAFLRLENPSTHADLKKRFPFQELVEETIEISDDQFDLAVPAGATALPRCRPEAGVWNCGWGAEVFTDFACVGSFPNSTISWCDAGKQFHFRDRWTSCGSKRWNSLGITAVCNTQIGYVRHYYQNCVSGNWHLKADWSIPGSHWAATRWCGDSKRARWVRHGVLDTPAGAYFRAFTAMYN